MATIGTIIGATNPILLRTTPTPITTPTTVIPLPIRTTPATATPLTIRTTPTTVTPLTIRTTPTTSTSTTTPTPVNGK